MAKALGLSVDLPLPFAAALDATRAALKAEGFGVLSEIDIRQAFKEKLDRNFRPYTILGACNPPLAFDALTEDPEVGLLLPCNVTVEEMESAICHVRVVDPRVLLAAAPGGLSPALGRVAEDAGQRLERVVAVLRRHGH